MLSVVFVLLINLPLLASLLNQGRTSLASLLHPMHIAAPPQPVSGLNDVPRFVSDSRAYFNKTHALRAELMRTHAVVKQRWFDTSPQSRVMLGTDGWLFLSADGSLENYRRSNPYSTEQLSAVVSDLQERVQFCRDSGCDYRLVVPPDKLSIYAEFLPERFEVADRPSRLDQLLSAIENTDMQDVVVDLRDDLRQAKSLGQLYYRTDTHWNRLGAHVGYESIVRSLQTCGARNSVPLEALCMSVSDAPVGGDLARMAGLRLDSFDEIVTVRRRDAGGIEFPGEVDFFAKDTAFFAQPTRDSTCKTGEFARGLVLHDSFGSPLLEYLAGHFETMRAERTTEFDKEAIRRVQPNVVIQVLVERALHRTP